MLGVGAIREHRESETGETTKPIQGFAAILRSLKRPEEIEELRKIYGSAFVVLAAYSPRARRVQNLARRIAESRSFNQAGTYMSVAEELEAMLRRLGLGQTWEGVHFSGSRNTAEAEGQPLFYFSRRTDHVLFTFSDGDLCCQKVLFLAVLERPELRSMLDNLSLKYGEI